MSYRDATEGDPGGSFPEQVGPCRLVRPLGAGATGTVFLSELLEDRPWGVAGDRVAVKLLHPELTRASRALRRFLREGRVGHGIRHPGVVRTHECASADVGGATLHYIVQEYVDGTTLSDLIREWGMIPEPLLRHLGTQLARGLAAIHDAGAVHRDLKPENVLLTPGHEVKIADLGIARLFEDDLSLTATGDFVGTPHHAAPEQFEGEAVGPAADLYAMGVLLHEAATGRLPFMSADRHGLRRLHVLHVPPPASTINPQISGLLDDLIALLLEKAPSSRPGSAGLVAEILELGDESPWWRERRLRRGPRARSSHPRRVRHAAPLAGRTEEMRRLRSLLAPAAAGTGARLLLVEGDAGMGKSRLVDEITAEAEARSELVLWGGNPPGQVGIARGAIAQSLLDHFGSDDLERRLASALGASRRLAAPLAAGLLGAAAAASARTPREDVTAAIALLVREMARETRVLWVLEDLHFAPAGEIAMLAAIVSAVESERVAVVATTRPSLSHADRAALAALPGCESLEIRRLDEAHVRELLASAAPTLPVSSRLAASLTRRTDGVPYFLFELLRSLERAGAELAEADAPPDVPASLRHLLLARLDGIEPADRELLEAASVVGAEVDATLVARLVGRDPFDVLRAFARLERTHGIVRGIGDRVAFDHHLMHEVVSESLLPALRRALHGRVADAIEQFAGAGLSGADAAMVVAHRVGAGQVARACEHAVAALTWLSRCGRHAEVADLAPRLLEGVAPTDLATRASLMATCVQSLQLIGRSSDARCLAEEAVPIAASAGDDAATVDLCLFLAIEASDGGDADAASEWHARGLEAAESSGDVRRKARVLMGRGLQHLLAGRQEMARADYERAVECASAAGEPALAAAALGHVATTWNHAGHAELGHATLLKAVSLAATAEPAQHPGTILQMLVQSHMLRGELDAARAAGREALALAQEFGRRPLEATTLSALCDVEIAAGNLQEARALANKSIALRRAVGGRRHDALGLWALAVIARIEGDLDEAESVVSQVLVQARATPTPLYIGAALRELGEIARSRGDVELARARFTEAAESHVTSGTRWVEVDCLMRRARVEIEGGMLEVARATLDDALALEAQYQDADEPSAFHVWRVIAGHCRHDLEGIPEPVQVHEAADLHLAFHFAGRPGDHLAQAMRKLEHLSRHLQGEARDRFWRCNGTARRARAAGG